MRRSLRVLSFFVLACGFAGTVGAASLDFFTLTPCRWLDTRGGAPLAAGEQRILPLAGACGLPLWAKVLVLNATAVHPAAAGTITFFPAGTVEPLVSSLAVSPGITRSNLVFVALPGDGSAAVQAHNDTGGTVDLALDVTGYFATGCIPPLTGLAAWWPFDETAGTVAHDVAGRNDGTYVNAPAHLAGVVDGARSFDKTQSVLVPASSRLNFGTGDFSFAAWLQTSRSGEFVDVVLDKRTASEAGYLGYHVFLYQGRLGLQLADGDYTNYGSSAFVADGAWHHVAITVQRGAADGIHWYVDGAEILPRHDPTPHRGSLDNTGPLTIAVRSAAVGSGDNFLGLLDEVEIFSRALSAEEVQAIWQAAAGGHCL